jgi:hypothetical protein
MRLVTMPTPGVHAAPGHAAVLRLDHHGHALGLQMVPDALRHFGGQAFLHLKPAGIAVQHARQLMPTTRLLGR